MSSAGFQLTLPEWGATFLPQGGNEQCGVSTHAPRVGSDSDRTFIAGKLPWFQLTLPEWGATIGRIGVVQDDSVSTHAPRVGSDLGLMHCSIR